MKTLITLFLITILSNAKADVFTYQECTDGDLAKLSGAHLLQNPLMNQMISDEIIPVVKNCEVMKPRNFYAQVCGQQITELDHYKITTENNIKYEITTNMTYKSCLRMRVFLQIDEFKMNK